MIKLQPLLRGLGPRFKIWLRADAELAEWGDLDTALEGPFHLIASYVALVIECDAVFVVAFGALQAITC